MSEKLGGGGNSSNEFEGEHVRGSVEGEISEDMYPQLEGESDDDYAKRLDSMRELAAMAQEDGERADAERAAEEYANSKLGKYEAYLREKQKNGVYKPEEVDAMVEKAKQRFEDEEKYEAWLEKQDEIKRKLGKVALEGMDGEGETPDTPEDPSKEIPEEEYPEEDPIEEAKREAEREQAWRDAYADKPEQPEKPEKPETPEEERGPLRAVALSREMDAKDAAKDIAEKMLKEDLAEGNRVSRFLKGIWKGNLFRGYYLGKNQKLAYEAISKKQAGQESDLKLDDSDWSERSKATIDRFISEYKEQMIHQGAGEWKDTLGANHEITVMAKEAIEKFASDPKMSEEAFGEEMKRVKEMLKEGDADKDRKALGGVVLDNYLDIAKTARERFEHEEGLENIMEGFDIVIGEARANVRTEAHRDALDKIMERWEKGSLSKFIPPEIVGGAASVAMWFGARGATNLARVATAGIGGSAVTGILAGIKERNRVTTDRAQMARQMASGLEMGKTKYDQELAATLYEGVPATQLAEDAKAALEGGNADVIRQTLLALESVTKMSDENKIDLIRFSDPAKIEEERFALDLARAELRAHLRKADPTMLEHLDTDITKRMAEIKEDTKDPKDAAFAKLRRKRSLAMGAKTAGFAALTMIGGQEIVAAISPEHYGLADQFGLNKGIKDIFGIRDDDADAKMTWMAGVLGFENPATSAAAELAAQNQPTVYEKQGAKLTPEEAEAYEKQGYIVNSHNVETTTQEQINLSAKEYAEAHGVKVVRDDWGANGTKFSDGNELRAYYTSGGDGIVTGMRGNSITWGGESINFEDALEDGKIRAFVSLTKDGQTTPIEITGRLVNGQMEFVPEPGSVAAECFKNGKFVGQYFEVVYDNGLDADGVQHIIPLATAVGEGMDGNMFADVKDVLTSETVYDIISPTPDIPEITPELMGSTPLSSIWQMASLGIPLTRRREFTNGTRRVAAEPTPENPPVETPAPVPAPENPISETPETPTPENPETPTPVPAGGEGQPAPETPEPAPENPPVEEPAQAGGAENPENPETPEEAPEGGRRVEDGYDAEGNPDWDSLASELGGDAGLDIIRGAYDNESPAKQEMIFSAWWDTLSPEMQARFSGAKGPNLLLSPDSDKLYDWLNATGRMLPAGVIYGGRQV